MQVRCALVPAILIAFAASAAAEEVPRELRVGRAGHAFDHLGGFADQAEAAAASGATIIYATGLGSLGYAGLPPANELSAVREAAIKYNRDAKARGIGLSVGYLCATSIQRIDAFDKNWPAELRSKFKTPPTEWRQQDQHGQPLASWYGGDYNPACMNNPDWRAYEEFMVRQQLETGHDGIFFDNPTIHQQGCYCPHCMERFANFLDENAAAANVGRSTTKLREYAVAHPQEFLQFRATIARDFLAHMREFARTINPRALVTCNNSLNSPGVLFSQCRMYGYNIAELSKAQDFVVVEDMVTQPRTEAGGQIIEYGPMYKQLHAISRGKPIIAVTLAGGDYHTAPNLVRLAMAEAAANGASYLSWPTWPEEQRARMIAAIRPQAELLRKHEELLNDASFRADVVLFLPFRRWVETDQCTASALAASLSQANIQFKVVSEEDFDARRISTGNVALLFDSLSVLTPAERNEIERYRESHGLVVTADNADWLKTLRRHATKSITVKGPFTVRAVVRDQPGRTIVHLLNLNVERLSSFEDRVTPAVDVQLSVRVPFTQVRAVQVYTADESGTSGPLEFNVRPDGNETIVDLTIQRLAINSIINIER